MAEGSSSMEEVLRKSSSKEGGGGGGDEKGGELGGGVEGFIRLVVGSDDSEGKDAKEEEDKAEVAYHLEHHRPSLSTQKLPEIVNSSMHPYITLSLLLSVIIEKISGIRFDFFWLGPPHPPFIMEVWIRASKARSKVVFPFFLYFILLYFIENAMMEKLSVESSPTCHFGLVKSIIDTYKA